MCIKTVTKLNLSRNGILSAQLRQAFKNDQAVIYDDKVAYEDNPETETLRLENEELKRLNAYLSEKLLAAPDINNSEVSEGESTDEADKQ